MTVEDLVPKGKEVLKKKEWNEKQIKKTPQNGDKTIEIQEPSESA